MSRHRNAQDNRTTVTRNSAQRTKLEKMGWKITRKKPRGWRLESPDGKKIIRVSCCLQRALSQALAYEVTGK